MPEGNFAEKQTCWFAVCSGTEARFAPALSLPLCGVVTERLVPSCPQPQSMVLPLMH